MENKVCSKCNEKKPFDDFTVNLKSLDGYKCWCKTCTKEYDKKAHVLRYSKNKIDINKKSNEHYHNNQDYYTQYRLLNNEKIKISINNCKRKRYYLDPVYRLRENIRRSINYNLKLKNITKKNRSCEILGCSYEEFKRYTESKWAIWMSWDNYGKYNGTPNYGWDIDHIEPISTGNTETELIRLSNYTNLQPLCSYINRVIKRDIPKSHS